MKNWQRLLANSLTHPAQILQRFNLSTGPLAQVVSRYPMRVNPYYLSLIRSPGDPLWLQAIPDAREIHDQVCLEDPLGEEDLSPVPNLVHKYPDRVLFLVTSQCAMYCRFCTRKRKVGTERMIISRETILAGLDYLRRTPKVRDVLLSGGDPLLLEDEQLEWILSALRRIPSIEIIRIGSRVPCTLPMRVTLKLAALLKKFHPLYINTHFNHPHEISPAAIQACSRLADAGIPLGCQTVLLRGVNDNPAILQQLFRQLMRIRVKPYYLFQADLSKGTNHFRTPVDTGLSIMKSLIGANIDPAVPVYAVDAPGGGGKISLLPDDELGTAAKVEFSTSGMICDYLNG